MELAATLSASGEFRFTLQEKRDRDGELYLFAGIHWLNAVLFIRQDPKIQGRWFASLKPYQPNGNNDDDLAWNSSEDNNRDTNKRK